MRASYPAQIIAGSLTSDGAKLKTKSERNPFETKKALFKKKIINTLSTTKRSCPGMGWNFILRERMKQRCNLIIL